MEQKNITFHEDIYTLYYYNLNYIFRSISRQFYGTILSNLKWVYMPSYKFSERNVSLQ